MWSIDTPLLSGWIFFSSLQQQFSLATYATVMGRNLWRVKPHCFIMGKLSLKRKVGLILLSEFFFCDFKIFSISVFI